MHPMHAGFLCMVRTRNINRQYGPGALQVDIRRTFIGKAIPDGLWR